ncbi:hypothetical protein B0T25DRAFT_542988 [Lasiosphaeria hispida]|uniref:Uncharacterized protein n=1 Tax=Lasiosphaeria hispida TaxID=260671 RepID=A0AAJ0HI63_9PEZI|nr:hypothetical protein B0T25DRAFT_542988 [Lasiosphaeria hispida]
MPKMSENGPHASLVIGAMRVHEEENILATEKNVHPDFHEKKRLNVRSSPFRERESRVGRAIKEDYSEELGYLLALGQLELNPKCPMARLLADDSGKGFHTLLSFCVDLDAAKCLSLLICWERGLPNSPYQYDHAGLLDQARTLMLRRGQMGCHVFLDPEPKVPGMESALQLVMAKSPDVVKSASRLFERSMDYYPWLMMHCGSDVAHPALIESLAAKIPNAHDLSYCEKWHGTYVSPLSVAAGMLNVSSMEVLMRRGAMAFEPFMKAGVLNHANPLFSAITQVFLPGKASDGVLSEFGSRNPNAVRQGTAPIKAWRVTIRTSAARMRTAVKMLLEEATDCFEGPGEYNEMLHIASMALIFTLRVNLFKAVQSLTDTRTQRKLLAADIPDRFRDVLSENAEPDSWAFFIDNKDEPYFWDRMWRRGLTVRDLRETLQRSNMLIDQDFVHTWLLLMTPKILEKAEMLANTKASVPRPGSLSTEDCLYVLLLSLEIGNNPSVRRVCSPESHLDCSDFERGSDSKAKTSGRWVTPSYVQGEGPIDKIDVTGSLEPTDSETEDDSDSEVGDDDVNYEAWLRFPSSR